MLKFIHKNTWRLQVNNIYAYVIFILEKAKWYLYFHNVNRNWAALPENWESMALCEAIEYFVYIIRVEYNQSLLSTLFY